MKTTASLALGLLFSLSTLAQQPNSATPPVPNNPNSMKDAIETTTKAPNQEVQAPEMGSVKRAKIFFVEPKNGARVPQNFKVKVAVQGYQLKPADGNATKNMTSGHPHLLIDGQPVKAGAILPKDQINEPLMKGGTETQISLPPGEHTLTVQFADGAHRSFGPEVSQTIKVRVE